MKTCENKTINYLLLVEGRELEVNMFDELFKKLWPDCSIIVSVEGVLKKYENQLISSADGQKRFFIVKPKVNTLTKIMNKVSRLGDNIEPYRIFFDCNEGYVFQHVFYVFDVDYTSATTLQSALSFFCDSTDKGLLLPSSPCIEAMCDFNASSFDLPIKKGVHISNQYKTGVRGVKTFLSRYSETAKRKKGISLFIRQNTCTLFRHCLKKNERLLKTEHYMEALERFNDPSCFPSITPTQRHYPFIGSFAYIIVGILFKCETKSNPTSFLDNVLKSYSFEDCDRATIEKLSVFI